MIVHGRHLKRAGFVILLLATTSLGGCTGDLASTLNNGTPLLPPQPETNFETPEFFFNPGLNQIGAQGAYAKGATGAGINVAVIDTGIDPTHPDLAPNLQLASIDITDGGAVDDPHGHGTNVAGVIAAVKNDSQAHGVAFDAKIMAIKAAPDSIALFFETDLINAVNHAVANGAHVINMSLGGTSPGSAEFEKVLKDATKAGVIIVASAGNDGNTFTPLFPAAYAGLSGFNGLLLAVGAVDFADGLASFSNVCGSINRNFCVYAPGVLVPTTAVGGGTTAVSGTSFSAPHVSGAIAVILQAFPSLLPPQAVNVLLTSTVDLGAAGTDDIFGRGRIDLRAALAPLGVLTVPTSSTVDGPAATLEATSLSLGPAFGDALAGLAFLDQAIILDGYQRPYKVALGHYVTGSAADFNLDSLLAAHRSNNLDLPLAGGINLAFGLSDDDTTAPALRREFSNQADPRPGLDSLYLTGGLDRDTRYGIGYNLSPRRQIAVLDGGAGPAGLFWAADGSLNPEARLIGPGDGFGVARRLGRNTRLSLAWLDNTKGDGDTRQGAIGQARLSHRFSTGAELGIGFANVIEDGAFLGSASAGAFGIGTEATSRFYRVQGHLPLGRGISLFASYTAAETEIDNGRGALLHDFDTVWADAFGLGIVATGVLGKGDRLGFLAGQPLRSFSADARLTLPVARDLDNNVILQSEDVELTPSGREIDLQIAYRRPLPGGFDLSSWAMMQIQPGHDQDAEPGYAAGFKIELNY